MKKIFSFFAAILFAGSMMAADAIHYSGTIAKADGAGGTDAKGNPTVVWAIGNKITVTQYKGTGSNPNSSYLGRIYTGNFVSFQAAAGYVIDTIIVSVDGSYYGEATPYAGTDTASNTVTKNTTDIDARIYSASGAKDTLINVKGDDLSEFFLQNPYKTSGKQLRFTTIDVRYTKLATTEPEVAADDVVFGTFVPGVSNPVKQLNVLGSNLSYPVVAELMMGTEFSISGTLTADGGTLSVTLNDLVGGDKFDNIQLSVNSVLMREVAVSAHVVETAGKGTQDDPFTCPDVANLDNTFPGNYWVEGYILGGYQGSGSVIDNTKNAGVLLAIAMDSPIDTISVQLPNSSDIRTALNVPDNNSAGWKVKVKGSLEKYGNFAGIKSPTEYQIISTPTAIDETEAAGKATKELREGQVLIIKGNKTYNILGQEIK